MHVLQHAADHIAGRASIGIAALLLADLIQINKSTYNRICDVLLFVLQRMQ